MMMFTLKNLQQGSGVTKHTENMGMTIGNKRSRNIMHNRDTANMET
jgi:hypothetical protein